jgi:F0F1-type ATP synthase assembly protein I
MAKEWHEGDMGGIALIAGGFVLVAMSVTGYELGAWIDRHLHDSPICAIIGLLLGTGIGIWDLYRIASRVMRAESRTSAASRGSKKQSVKNSVQAEKDECVRDQHHEL